MERVKIITLPPGCPLTFTVRDAGGGVGGYGLLAGDFFRFDHDDDSGPWWECVASPRRDQDGTVRVRCRKLATQMHGRRREFWRDTMMFTAGSTPAAPASDFKFYEVDDG